MTAATVLDRSMFADALAAERALLVVAERLSDEAATWQGTAADALGDALHADPQTNRLAARLVHLAVERNADLLRLVLRTRARVRELHDLAGGPLPVVPGEKP